MTSRAMTLCRHPGCGKAIARPGFCERHAQQHQQEQAARDQRRGSAHQRGYTSKWQRARAGFLALHPLCDECARHGRVSAATVVDHIKPHKGDRALFWDRDNWQPLCKPCHDAKTAREDGGFGNFARGQGAGQKSSALLERPRPKSTFCARKFQGGGIGNVVKGRGQ